jgi:hypothetical protein
MEVDRKVMKLGGLDMIYSITIIEKENSKRSLLICLRFK